LEIKKCTFFGFALVQVEIFLGNVVEWET
jgi:hypothetical protein